MLLNKVTVNWTLSSENWIWPWSIISLWYRDLWTWEITILNSSETYETSSWWFTDSATDSWFTISANNVQVYEWWKQLIIIYNWKYQEIHLNEDNIVWLTWIVNWKFIYDMKTENDSTNFEASFVKNSKTTLFDDPIINWYIIEDWFKNSTNVLPLTWKLKEEVESYYSKKYWIDHWEFSRKLEVEYAYEQWIPIEQLYDSLFKNTNLEETLINSWYSKEQISKIRKEWMLKNMSTYQDVNKADWQIRVEEKLKDYRENPEKLDNLSWNTQKKNKENTSEDVKWEELKIGKDIIEIKVWDIRKEEELVQWNDFFNILNLILLFIFTLSIAWFIIFKIIKLKRKSN